METINILYMYFKDSDGKIKSITIEEPRDEVTNEEIGLAMDTIIEKNIFEYQLLTKDSAKLVTKTIQDLEI